MISDSENCIFQEKEKSTAHDELLKFVQDTRAKLNIVFPENIDHFIISEQIANAMVSKKLRDNINIKLLHHYNENIKLIIKRISPCESFMSIKP